MCPSSRPYWGRGLVHSWHLHKGKAWAPDRGAPGLEARAEQTQWEQWGRVATSVLVWDEGSRATERDRDCAEPPLALLLDPPSKSGTGPCQLTLSERKAEDGPGSPGLGSCHLARNPATAVSHHASLLLLWASITPFLSLPFALFPWFPH